jgi:SAM-dependent methyltransferase
MPVEAPGPGAAVDYSATARDYARYRAGFPDELFERLQAMGVGRAGQRILDLGTGTGDLARGFARRGADVIGLDISGDLLAVAEDLDREAGVRVEYRVGIAEETGMGAASCDVVSAAQCWHWFDRPRAAREVRRVLAAGGSVAICQLDRPHIPGSVGLATLELQLRHNPEFKLPYGDLAGHGIYPPWLGDLSEAGFVHLETFSFDITIPYTHEAWRGRCRASGPCSGSMDAADVERFDRELAELLAEEYPDEPMEVPHRVWAVVGRVPA